MRAAFARRQRIAGIWIKVWTQHVRRHIPTGQLTYGKRALGRDHLPLRYSATTQTKRFRHGDNTARVLGNIFYVHGASLAVLYKQSQAPLDLFGLALLYASPMSIGARLRQLRTSHSMNQEQLGELCGVTKGMVSQWELDIVTPPTDRLIELHKKLSFSFDWLLNGESKTDTYATSDPKLVAIMKALEPRAEYVKDAAVSAVLTTCELAERAKSNGSSNGTDG